VVVDCGKEAYIGEAKRGRKKLSQKRQNGYSSKKEVMIIQN